ncbi:MAG: hypothetical protein AB8I80_08690, partial [Anaerolineae bacterium]
SALRNRFADLKAFGVWMQERGLDDRSLFDTLSDDLLVARCMAALVESVITAAHKEMGSLGLGRTLLAMQERRIQTLVIQEGYRHAGRVCTNCGYLTLSESDVCSVCGGGVQVLEDIVDHLVHRAIEMDVEVVFVDDERLVEAGGIGSIWRF